MAILTAGNSIAIQVYVDQTVSITVNHNNAGRISFAPVNSEFPPPADGVGRSFGPMAYSKTFGPWGIPGTVTINCDQGLLTYTVSASTFPAATNNFSGNVNVSGDTSVSGNLAVTGQFSVGSFSPATLSPPAETGYQVTTSALPTIRPSLLLDFANTKTLDPRITFTRASTGKYYDGTTTALAEQNLLTYSQLLTNNPWGTNSATRTGNSAAAPDGTTTATTISATAAMGELYQPQTLTAGSTYTFSVYLMRKTGTGNIQIKIATTSTVAITGSWARYTWTETVGTTGTYYPGLYIATSGDEVYAWGAQLEQRSTVTAYNATTSAPITNYIPVMQTAPANVARFDCDPVTGESKGLLIEQQSTNLLTYSSNFENAAWNKARCTITTAADIAPDGTQTAEILVEDTSTNSHPIYRPISGLTSGTAYTFSVYAKPFGRTQIAVNCSSTAFPSIGTVIFDISSGSVTTATNATGSISSVGNGWFRCVLVATAGASGSGDFYVQPAVGGASSYTGNGYSGIYLWGAQLEALSFPTSYIPTVASQVTRAADNASMTGTNFSSWYNAGQGTFAVNFVVNNFSGNKPILGNNTSSQLMMYIANGSGCLSAHDTLNYATTVNASTAASNTKGAITYSSTLNAALNGGAIASSAYSGSFNGISTLSIGSYSSAVYMNGTMQRLIYYPLALTSANLQALTTQ